MKIPGTYNRYSRVMAFDVWITFWALIECTDLENKIQVEDIRVWDSFDSFHRRKDPQYFF